MCCAAVQVRACVRGVRACHRQANTPRARSGRAEDRIVKIGDFGLATDKPAAAGAGAGAGAGTLESVVAHTMTGDLTDEDVTKGVGTEWYRAPEQAESDRYGTAVDMYSLGIVLFEMWAGRFGTGMERVQALMALKRDGSVPKDFHAPLFATKLIRMLLAQSPAARPTAEQVLDMPDLPARSEVDDSSLNDAVQAIERRRMNFVERLLGALLACPTADHVDYLFEHPEAGDAARAGVEQLVTIEVCDAL